MILLALLAPVIVRTPEGKSGMYQSYFYFLSSPDQLLLRVLKLPVVMHCAPLQ